MACTRVSCFARVRGYCYVRVRAYTGRRSNGDEGIYRWYRTARRRCWARDRCEPPDAARSRTRNSHARGRICSRERPTACTSTGASVVCSHRRVARSIDRLGSARLGSTHGALRCGPQAWRGERGGGRHTTDGTPLDARALRALARAAPSNGLCLRYDANSSIRRALDPFLSFFFLPLSLSLSLSLSVSSPLFYVPGPVVVFLGERVPRVNKRPNSACPQCFPSCTIAFSSSAAVAKGRSCL